MNLGFLPVSAGRLRSRAVKYGRVRIRALSLFPFFDPSGRVRRVMATTPDSSDIYVLPAGDHLPRIPGFGDIRVPERVGLLRPIQRSDLEELQRLWHYDPWWVLAHERFAGHWARTALMETNYVERSEKNVVRLYYRSDLSRTEWILVKEGPLSYSFDRWSELWFPPRARRRGSRASLPRGKETSAWVLDPIWTRK